MNFTKNKKNLIKTETQGFFFKQEDIDYISHEMRTPLNGILGLTKLLSQENLSKRSLTYCKSIEQSGNLLLELVNELLARSELHSKEFKEHLHTFNPTKLLVDCLEIIVPNASSKNLSLSYYGDKHIPELISADKTRFRQIIFNLVGNAIKYTDKGGVAVHLYPYLYIKNSFAIRIDIIDSGIGLEQTQISNLFKKYQRFDQESSTTQGTGIGLAITKKIINNLGGQIKVFSKKNQGSIFSVILPCTIKSKPKINISTGNFDKSLLIACKCKVLSSTLIRQAVQIGFNKIKIITEINELLYLLQNQDNIALIEQAWAEDNKFLQHNITNTNLKKISMILHYQDNHRYKNYYNMGINSFLIQPIREISLLTQLQRLNKNETSLVINKIKNDRPKACHAPSNKENKHLILLVEDNKINAILAGALLKKLNFTYDHAINGQEALDMLMKKDYLAILMDMHMPILNGLDTTKIIRQSNNNYKNIPIIALTANVTQRDKDICSQAGMNGFLAKPINPNNLWQELQKTLTKKKSNVA